MTGIINKKIYIIQKQYTEWKKTSYFHILYFETLAIKTNKLQKFFKIGIHKNK